jgi:hypothetical protein
MKPVHVVTDYHEKQLQRALLQYNRPDNAPLVREALRLAGREDLIGYGEECLVRPEQHGRGDYPKKSKSQAQNNAARTKDGGKRNDGKRSAPQKKGAKPQQSAKGSKKNVSARPAGEAKPKYAQIKRKNKS